MSNPNKLRKSRYSPKGLATPKRACEANPAGENSSVPLYHFKLVYVVLRMAVKEASKPTSKNREMAILIGLHL